MVSGHESCECDAVLQELLEAMVSGHESCECGTVLWEAVVSSHESCECDAVLQEEMVSGHESCECHIVLQETVVSGWLWHWQTSGKGEVWKCVSGSREEQQIYPGPEGTTTWQRQMYLNTALCSKNSRILSNCNIFSLICYPTHQNKE